MAGSRFDKSSCDQLARCIREIEEQTDAEIVVAVRRRSATYRHADILFGTIASYAALIFLLFSPWPFSPFWIAFDVALVFVLAVYLSSRFAGLRRRFTTKEERAEAVRRGAAAMFYDAGIANTSREVGVLIYLSLFEKRLELIADRGVLEAVPPLEWNERMFELRQSGRRPNVSTLLENLRNLGALLKQHLPATAENPNELRDVPHFELK